MAIENLIAGFPTKEWGTIEVKGMRGETNAAEVYHCLWTPKGDSKTIDVAVKKSKPGCVRSLIGTEKNPHERIQNELDAFKKLKLSHPNLVFLHEGKVVGDAVYLIMEYVNGPKLSDLIETLPIKEGLKYIVGVCDAIDQIHNAGKVHRDVSPGNIYIDKILDIAKLGDFELLSGPGSTYHSTGTPCYAAPEQLIETAGGKRHAYPSSDIFSLGAIIYQLENGGQALFTDPGYTKEQYLNSKLETISINNDLLTACIKRCLQYNPEDRYQSVKTLKYDLIMAIRHDAEAKSIENLLASHRPSGALLPQDVAKTIKQEAGSLLKAMTKDGLADYEHIYASSVLPNFAARVKHDEEIIISKLKEWGVKKGENGKCTFTNPPERLDEITLKKQIDEWHELLCCYGQDQYAGRIVDDDKI